MQTLRLDSGIIAIRRACYGRAQDEPLSFRSERAPRDPGQARVPFVILPRLEVVARRRKFEPCLFACAAETHEIRDGKLFVRQHETHTRCQPG
jgi:hypothetical protein